MSFNAIFKPGLIRVQTGTTPPPITFDVKHLAGWNLDKAIEAEIQHGAGMIHPTYTGGRVQRPICTSRTRDLRNLLNKCIPIGFEITTTGSASPTDLYMLKWAELGLAAGSVHKKITINKGLITLRQLSWNGVQPAELEFAVNAVYDGTNNPFAIANNVASPGNAVMDVVEYGGPVVVDGTKIDGVVGVAMDFGVEVEALEDEGKSKPTRAHARIVVNRIRVTTRGAGNFDGFGDEGAKVLTDWAVYLRQGAMGSPARTADATAAHVKLSGVTGYVFPGPASGDGDTTGQQQVTIIPRHDGTNPYAAYSGASAIP